MDTNSQKKGAQGDQRGFGYVNNEKNLNKKYTTQKNSQHMQHLRQKVNHGATSRGS